MPGAVAAEFTIPKSIAVDFGPSDSRCTSLGMVKTDEFAVKRFGGDKERAAKIYEGVAEPLTADDVAEAVRWSVMLPHHFNIDLMVIRPLAQAAQHKVVRRV